MFRKHTSQRIPLKIYAILADLINSSVRSILQKQLECWLTDKVSCFLSLYLKRLSRGPAFLLTITLVLFPSKIFLLQIWQPLVYKTNISMPSITFCLTARSVYAIHPIRLPGTGKSFLMTQIQKSRFHLTKEIILTFDLCTVLSQSHQILLSTKQFTHEANEHTLIHLRGLRAG